MDVAAFRRQVQRTLDAAFARVARQRRFLLSDPRVRRWIESVIRYRKRSRLEPVSKDGLPGDVGRAEVTDNFTATEALRLNGMFEGRTDYDTMQDPPKEFDSVVLKSDIAAGFVTNAKLLGSLGDWLTWYYPVEPGNELCTPTQDGCRLDNPCVSAPKSVLWPPRTQYARMFTGEMVKVAQLLYGMGQHVPYRYCWVRSHGIFIAGNGDRWVIEISADDGITAWKLAVWNIADPGGLPYEPQPIPDLPYLASRKLLLDAAGLSEFYDPGQNPFFAECGWAFSPDGHAAVNTSWDDYNEGPLPTDVRSKRSTVWDITITEANNEPESASIVKDGPHFLFNEADTLNSIKFPTYGANGACYVSTFLSFGQLEPPSYDRAPVYAYYEGSQRVVWWHRVDRTQIEFKDGRPPGKKFGCLQGQGYWAPYGTGGGSYEYGTDTLSGVVWYEKEGGTPRGISRNQPYYTQRASTYSWSWQQMGGYISANDPVGNPSIFSEHWELQETLTDYGYAEPNRWEQLLIPFHERSGVYLLQAKADSIGQDVQVQTTTDVCLTHAKGDYYDEGSNASYRDYDPYFETNPCDCEITPPIPPIIGRWSFDLTPVGNVSGDYVGASTGVFFKNPQLDPNRGDRTLFCFDGGRGTGETTDGCSYSSACKCIEDTSQQTVDPATPGHVRMEYHTDGSVYRVIDDDYDFTTYDPYWRFIQSPGQDGCQRLDAMIDGFSGSGTVAVDIVDPFVFTTRLKIPGVADAYPQDQRNLFSAGWIGMP